METNSKTWLIKIKSDCVYYRLDVYIGSDNDSKRIGEDYLEKIKRWANSAFPDGYTLFKGEGCYNGISEDSVLINILSLYDIPIRDRLEALKKDLKQESILVVKSAVEYELV